jgi:hypothetical protein
LQDGAGCCYTAAPLAEVDCAPHHPLWHRNNVFPATITQASHLVDEVADVLPQHHHVDACNVTHTAARHVLKSLHDPADAVYSEYILA